MSKISIHYNTGNLKDTELPPWIIHCKGVTYYCHRFAVHVPCHGDYNPERERVKAKIVCKGRLQLTDLLAENTYDTIYVHPNMMDATDADETTYGQQPH